MTADLEGAAAELPINRLLVSLELDLAGSRFSIPAGNIKRFALRLDPYGFTAQLSFWFICLKDESEDKIKAKFVLPEVALAKLTIDRGFDTVGESADPLLLQGLVVSRDFSERVFEGMTGQPVLQRNYALSFADRAQVLWRQHFPTALYVDSTLAALIDENTPDGVQLTHAWQASAVRHPVLSLPLGASAQGASFYDYLHWLLNRHQAGLLYDYQADAYTISDKKREFGAEVESEPKDVREWRTVLRPPCRSTISVLNGSTLAGTGEQTLTHASSVAGVKRQYLMRSSVDNDLGERAKLEAKRHAPRALGARVTFARFPSTTMRPNLALKCGQWSAAAYHVAYKFRVCHVRLDAEATSQLPTDDAEDPSNAYLVDYRAELEGSEEPHFAYPGYCAPCWDLRVEGIVVSEVGDGPEETYQPYRDEQTSLDYYRVEIPLWKKQKVIVAYEPLFAPGHFYFPMYKGSRVLVQLRHDRATVVGFLDFRPGARLPLETQGNHLLMGKKAQDQTSIRHIYKDARPQLHIERSHGKDKQTLEVSEGRIVLETVSTDS